MYIIFLRSPYYLQWRKHLKYKNNIYIKDIQKVYNNAESTMLIHFLISKFSSIFMDISKYLDTPNLHMITYISMLTEINHIKKYIFSMIRFISVQLFSKNGS